VRKARVSGDVFTSSPNRRLVVDGHCGYHLRHMPDKRTFLYEVVGGAHVAVHGALPPSDEEWKAYLHHITAHLGEIKGVIVNTEGAGPNATQRGFATEHWKAYDGGPRMSIMTMSTFVRGMVTALSWFLGQTVKAFPIDDYDGAGAHIGLEQRQIDLVRMAVIRLRAAVPKESSSSNNK
jgi:hypothetical protein